MDELNYSWIPGSISSYNAVKARKKLADSLASEGWMPVEDWNKVPAGSLTRNESYSYGFRSGKDGYSTNKESMAFYKAGASPAPASAPAAPTPAPSPPLPVTPDLSQPNAVAAYGNPALTIPGVNVRLTGENIGLKAKRAGSSGAVGSRGTGRLIIPRSSGSTSLNI